MDLSVVITHHREENLLRKCLRALEVELKNLEDIESEIIVIMSEFRSDFLAGLRNDFPEIRFLPFKDNLYFVRSANRGLAQARGEFILLINDDVIISPGSIKLMLDFLKGNGKIGLLGPKIIYPNGLEQPSSFRFYSPLTILCRRTFFGKLKVCQKHLNYFLYRNKDLNRAEGVEVDWIMNGSGILTRKEHLQKVGFLDERFTHYMSDVDWCRRFWQKGFKVVYFPQAVFCHYHGKLSQGRGIASLFFNKMARLHLIDGLKYFWKWKACECQNSNVKSF